MGDYYSYELNQFNLNLIRTLTVSEEKKSKLSKLKEQLKGVSEDSSSDDESEESEEK